jgi:nucleoside-diphosphate-sugar epimerase
MSAEDTIFLTGFPGFIASRLLRRLAKEGGRFLLLVQPSFAQRAELELRKIAEESGKSVSDFVILPGDITKPDLGLSPADLQTARAQSNVLFHLAAVYDLAVTRDLGLLVNVEGTRNVNQFARSLIRNYYEETKYLAEMEVEALKSDLPTTIHRPAVVCGDSRTGETVKYDGIYYLIRYLLKWPSVLSNFNIGNSDVSLNLVPVDFVVEAMSALARDLRSVGKTVQLADPQPLTTRELFNEVARAIEGRGSRVTLPAFVVQSSLMLPLAPKITDLPHYAVPYFFLKQTYDTTQARELLECHGVSCPPFESYVKTIVDYAAHHPVL